MYYYYFKDLFINLFNELNIDIIVSPETTREILELGEKYASDEMCLAMKVFIGHVAYLEGKCDYVLIPRVENYGLSSQTCTNFLAIYDIINNLFNMRIINYNINLRKKETELKGLIKELKKLGLSKKEIKDAYTIAKVKESKIKKNNVLNNLRNLRSEKSKILIVGHPYNINDKLIGGDVLKILKKLNVEIIYSDLFYTKDEYLNYSKGLYFKDSKDNISSISKCYNKINGIIFISSFPCGTDSLIFELVMRKLNKPYLNLVIDDQESSVGIETRIESFIDIISSMIR